MGTGSSACKPIETFATILMIFYVFYLFISLKLFFFLRDEVVNERSWLELCFILYPNLLYVI
jgi:hypothetical protein